MNYFTLLNVDEIIGNKQLDIFKRYGTSCSISDFAILLDGFVLNNYHACGGYSLACRTGKWYTCSSYDDDFVYIIDHRGCRAVSSNLGRQCGIRPVLLCNDIFNNNKIGEFCYGEYPQSVVDNSFAHKLEFLYNNDDLIKTGKVYTLDSAHVYTSSARFMGRDFIEYEYEGKKYIRFNTDFSYCNGNLLSDGRKIYSNYIYWVSVEPIVWIIDYKSGIAISKNILAAGIQFNNYSKVNGNFEDSDIFTYLNEVFSRNIFPSYSSDRKLVKKIN